MALLHVGAQLVVPVELHATAALVATEERSVVLLKVTATITNASVGGIAAQLRAEEKAVVGSQYHCLRQDAQSLLCEDWVDGGGYPGHLSACCLHAAMAEVAGETLTMVAWCRGRCKDSVSGRNLAVMATGPIEGIPA
jgi:hypothetical protein